jgi:hypothetical protein
MRRAQILVKNPSSIFPDFLLVMRDILKVFAGFFHVALSRRIIAYQHQKKNWGLRLRAAAPNFLADNFF